MGYLTGQTLQYTMRFSSQPDGAPVDPTAITVALQLLVNGKRREVAAYTEEDLDNPGTGIYILQHTFDRPGQYYILIQTDTDAEDRFIGRVSPY